MKCFIKETLDYSLEDFLTCIEMLNHRIQIRSLTVGMFGFWGVFLLLLCWTYGMWKFPGQGLNPHHSCSLQHSCSNARSLIHCATWEPPVSTFLSILLSSEELLILWHSSSQTWVIGESPRRFVSGLLGPAPKVFWFRQWRAARKFAFLTGSQVMLMLLVWKPHCTSDSFL